jgi:hypothetical protein
VDCKFLNFGVKIEKPLILHGLKVNFSLKTINHFIDDNIFYMLSVSYSIFLIKKYTMNIYSYKFQFSKQDNE